MLSRSYTPAFLPPLRDAADTANFDAEFTNEPVLDGGGDEPPPGGGGEDGAFGDDGAFAGWDSFIVHVGGAGGAGAQAEESG